MGWLIALAVLILILLLPVGIRAVYNEYGAFAWLLIGPVRFLLHPGKPTKRSGKTETKRSTENFPSKADKTSANKGGKLTDFLPLAKIVLEALGELRRKLKIKRLEMKLILGGDDPCDLSIHYGRAWAALGNLMPLLEQVFVIKKRDMEVECDYTSDETVIYARLDMNISIGKLLYIAVCYGVRGLREYFKIQNKRKGGAAT